MSTRALSRTPLAGCLVAWLFSLCVPPARAESQNRAQDSRDRFELSVHSETHAELFRRALLPGPSGSLVSTDTVAPVFEFLSVRATDLDTGWRKDSLDFELATWARVWLGTRDTERPVDGDIQIANARYRHGPVSVRVGRQQLAGAAARFVRFDGANLEAALGAGVDANAYFGWTVLPRWNQRLRYQHLGAPSDTLLRDSVEFEAAPREAYWLAGGRVGFSSVERRAGVSFHEQREPGGVSRRSLGVDGRTPLVGRASLGTSALLDLDAVHVADARVWLDTSPSLATDLSFEYLHAEPALFLSRQSVLSVFSTATYDEAGSYASVRASRALAFDGSGFVQVYDEGRPGARSELAMRLFPDPARSTFVRLAYARVVSPGNGYHSLRSSLSQRFTQRFRGTVEAYAYLYDKAIRSYRASTVYAGTLSFDPASELSLLLGASLSHSPYASLEAQTTLRASYAFDLSRHRRRR